MRRSQEALALAQALAHPYSLALAQHCAAYPASPPPGGRGGPGAGRRPPDPGDRAGVSALGGVWAPAGGAGRWPCRARARRAWPSCARAWRPSWPRGRSCRGRSVCSCWPRSRGTPARSRRGCACWPRPWRRWRPAGEGTCWRRRIGSRAPCCCSQAVPDAAQAEACFQQALAIARRQQAKSWELRAAMSLSRLWQQQGKRAEAHDAAGPALRLVHRGL